MRVFRKSFSVASSGSKGGTGKTMNASALAKELSERGYRTAILDLDVRAPNLFRALGIEEDSVEFTKDKRMLPKWVNENLAAFSTSLFFKRTQGIAWQSDIAVQYIEASFVDVDWGKKAYDFVIGDVCPSDVDALQVLGKLFSGRIYAVMTTTPRMVSIDNCERGVHLSMKYRIPILGFVANMTGAFGSPETVRALATKYNVPLMGEIPLNFKLGEAMDEGRVILKELYPDFVNGLADAVITKSGKRR